MKIEDGPRTWICKTSKSGNSIAVAYGSLIKNRVAGFSLVDIDPSEYPDLKTLKDNIVVQNKKENILTGRTFGPQAWSIYSQAKQGDRIFLECHDADKKPKGKNRTFIVAAGVITGPFKYTPEKADSIGILSTGVDWLWQGKELLDYRHNMYCFTVVDRANPANSTLLEKLDRIFKAKPTNHAQTVDGPIVKPDSRSAIEFDSDWREGDAKMRQHLTLERCSKAALAAKNLAREKTGFISCECCQSTPAKAYGHELIDAHHIIPLADTKGMSRTPSAADFAMLCPTCHRAVHKELKGRTEGKSAIISVRNKLAKK